ncbi:MAG: hypothetical protein AAF318_00545 [Pseudomonadota bacterium]
MAYATFDSTLTGSPKERSVFARIGQRIVEARKAEAQAAVNAYLLSLDDETLTALGHDRATLEATNPRGYPFL